MDKFFTSNQIEELAKRIRDKFNIESDEFAIDITKLATLIGCNVYEVSFTDNNIAGTFEIKNDDKIINVNQNDKEERKRFTIAHELSHYILHNNDDGSASHIDYRQPLNYYKDPKDLKKEIQANMLAAALLMPRDLVKRIWEATNDIDDIAERFYVSKQAATIRLESLGLLE